MPGGIKPDGTPTSRANEDDDSVSYEVIPIEEDGTAAVGARSSKITDIRVTHKDTEKHAATPGCPARKRIFDSTKASRGVGHSAVCRERIHDLVEIDEDTRDRVDRADQPNEKRKDIVGHFRTS